MDAFRRTRYAVTLLILVMALFVSAETVFLGNVLAGGVLTIHGGQGNPAGSGFYNTVADGHGFTGEDVGIFGSLTPTNAGATITTCSVSSPSSSAVINGVCTITTVSPTAGGTVSFNGTFTVGNVVPGDYLIQVNDNNGGGSLAQSTLVVDTGPVLQLAPKKGPTGTSVQFNATWLQPSDTSCTVGVASGTSSSFIAPSSAGCSTFAVQNATTGAHHGFFTQNATGSFVVGNVPSGQYVVQVTGSSGDFAQAVFNVTSGPFIQLCVSGLSGASSCNIRVQAKGPIGTHVNIEGSNFLESDTSCSLGSPTNGVVIVNGACSFFTNGSSFQNVTGSFEIGNVPQGQYVIQVSGNGGDFAQAIINVTAGAFIQLGVNGNHVSKGQVASGPIGTHVDIEGSQFLSNDGFNSATCSLSSPTSGTIISNGACSFFKTPSDAVNVTGSFIVGNVPEGQYVIQVSGSAGDSAEAVFNVTAGAFIQLGVAGIYLHIGQVQSGPTGTHVSIEGSQFLPNDAFNSATCSISSPTLATVVQGGACSFFKTNTGLVNVTGSFIVGNVGAGQYVIQVSGSAGDSAQAVFNVTRGPFIQLGLFSTTAGKVIYTPFGQTTSGPLGVTVYVSGSYFTATATTCSISSPTSAAIMTGGACAVFIPSSGGFVGFANVTGSFIVGNVLPGQYVIRVTDNTGSFADAIFNVTLGAQITLSPATAPPGHSIIVNGTGFLPTDTVCVISSPGSSAVLAGSAACAIRAGTGVISGSFIVGNVLPGQYVIQVTGNQGDFAQRVLNVTAGPRLTLSPATGHIGTSILVNGTGFLTTDQSCSISSISSPNPILTGSAACVISVGTGIVRGSFIIGNVAPGEYVIEVTGCAGNNGCTPSAGDFAQDIVTVALLPSTLTIFPTNATNGATVTFVGSGYSASDTGCVVEAVVEQPGPEPRVFTQDTSLITSPTCSIVSSTNVQGSFVVSPYATENINWTVRVMGTPADDVENAVFNVTASVVVTPTSGSINTVFTYTGSGFESDATTCHATIIPALSKEPSCAISAGIGQVSGSIVMPSTAVAGTYAIVVGDNTGSNATGVFTVGTPTALVVLSPASVDQDQPVGVAGTGFNPQDAYCVITSGGTPPWSGTNGVAPNCAMSSGYASGSFVVSTTAPGGYYLITVQGCSVAPTSNVCPTADLLDFASNFLGVTLSTTVTTYSTTTTSSSTTTSLSTTTTSVATSFSYSSTTYSTTGILFTTYTHYTLTTVSGQTTTIVTQTTSSTQTQTTVTVSTTTSFTTVGCGPLPCGFAVQPTVNPAPGIDSAGLLVSLLLLIPMLLRRLFS